MINFTEDERSRLLLLVTAKALEPSSIPFDGEKAGPYLEAMALLTRAQLHIKDGVERGQKERVERAQVLLLVAMSELFDWLKQHGFNVAGGSDILPGGEADSSYVDQDRGGA